MDKKCVERILPLSGAKYVIVTTFGLGKHVYISTKIVNSGSLVVVGSNSVKPSIFSKRAKKSKESK